MRGFATTILIVGLAAPMAPGSGLARPLHVRSPWSQTTLTPGGARAGSGAQVTPAPAVNPHPWTGIQEAREKRWRSFPDLIVHPSREWTPHFGDHADRRGVRAPLESARRASADAPSARTAGAAPRAIRVAMIRIDFETDRRGGESTGNGRFDLGNPGSAVPAIDRPPHNREFYLDHLEALRRYYHAQSYGTVDIQGEVWPRNDAIKNAYRVSDMADFGPWTFGQSIYPAAVHMFKTFLNAANEQAMALADTIPWHTYDGIMLIHAGSDLQSDVLQDSPLDIPTFTIGVADTDRVVFPDSTIRCPDDPDDPLAKYCPIGQALFLPETANQDGYYAAINGLVAHEAGHLLFGLSDLYDIENGLPVVGFWSLMDTGNLAGAVIPQDNGEDIYAVGLLPPSIDPFQRFFVGDALTLPEVAYDGAESTLLDSERNPDIRSVTLTADEFLLVENRAIAPGDTLELDQDPDTRVILGPKTPDPYEYDALLPIWPEDHPKRGDASGGILVWHIDASVITFNNSLRVNDSFGWNTNFRRKGVSVIEADGLEDLGDLGSPLLLGSYRDPFYLGNTTVLSDTTVPDLKPNIGTRPHVRLDFLDEPGLTMRFTARRTWQLPGWPVEANFPPGGPQLLAIDADGAPDGGLEVCWAGGDTTSADANGLFVLKRDGQGLLGTSALLASLPGRPRPLLAALPRGPGGAGPSWLAASTEIAGDGSGGEVWLVDADPNNAGQPAPGWPPALPSKVTTPPVIVSTHPNARILVGCEDGFVYALAADGTVQARTQDPLAGGITGRLAAARIGAPGVGGGGGPGYVSNGWILAAGSASGEVGVWGLDDLAPPGAQLPFVLGWPRDMAEYPGFAPDFLWLDFDGAGPAAGNPSGCRAGLPELVAHDRDRLWAFCAEGNPLPGWGRGPGDALVASLGAGDPDGDGYPEVLTQTLDSKVSFVNLTGYPSPGWPKAGSGEGVLSENPELTYPNPPRTFPTTSPPLAIDLDGDGRSEVVAPNTSGIIAALDADGRTPAGWPLATGAGAGGSAVAADLDGDGYLELVAPDRFGLLFAYTLPVPAAPTSSHPWGMVGGGPGRTSSLPAGVMASTPAPVAGPLVVGSLKAYPNPARMRPVKFAYQLSEPADVEFRILDSSGHEVASFARSGRRADNLEVWEPGDLPAGLYLARVRFRSSGGEAVQVLPLGLLR